MTIQEYLRTHLPFNYQIRPRISISTYIPSNIDYRATSQTFIKGKTYNNILLTNEDGAVITENWIIRKQHIPSISYIIRWLQDKLFTPMILNAAKKDIKTELVRLRIAINMIYSLDNKTLTQKEKNIWVEGIKDLYWNRKRAIIDWRLKYVDKVPF